MNMIEVVFRLSRGTPGGQEELLTYDLTVRRVPSPGETLTFEIRGKSVRFTVSNYADTKYPGGVVTVPLTLYGPCLDPGIWEETMLLLRENGWRYTPAPNRAQLT